MGGYALLRGAIVQHANAHREQRPLKIAETLYRIDLRESGVNWKWQQFWKVLEAYPYATAQRTTSQKEIAAYDPPLVVRGDWLCVVLADWTETDLNNQPILAQQRFLYNAAKFTRQDFFKFWQVNTDPNQAIGFIEGQSGVSVLGTRWLVAHPAAWNECWITLDTFRLTSKVDPLNNLDYGRQGYLKDGIHDGEETIVGGRLSSKLSLKRGRLQYYFLSSGKGEGVTEAPPRLVATQPDFRGYSGIINFGSCVLCHKQGLISPTFNQTQEFFANTRIYTKNYKDAAAVEQFLIFPVKEQLERANAEYAIGIELCNGLTPEKNVENFRAAMNWYDAKLDFEQVCRELYTDADELRLAFGAESNSQYDIDPRLALVASEKPIPRRSFESLYYEAALAIAKWRALQGMDK